MKMMKRTLLMAAAVLALAACSDDDGPDGPQLVTETVTFEDATLNTSGILTGEKLAEEVTGDTGTYKEYSGTFYTSGTASFQCYYSDQWGSSYTAGFTVSNNTNMETPGFGNQYSVYAKGGAKDSKKFAVGYYDSYNASQGKAGAVPTVTFSKKVNPLNIWISNSTYAFRWWTLGEGDMAGTIAPPEKVDAILSMRGYADGTLKKEVAFKLVDEEKGAGRRRVDECRPDAAGLGGQDRVPLRLRERKCSGLFLYRRSDGGHGVELLTCAVPGIGRGLSATAERPLPLFTAVLLKATI
ncbi:DUF4465 domain-containing protein [Alistipes communis]|nr:DUF4465 domain-containing protein [Alistipes communis]